MSDGPSDARREMDDGGWNIPGPKLRKPKVSPAHTCAEADKLRSERDALRQQLTNAIDERNIARKESTALAGQLAAVTKERDEARRFKGWVHSYLDGHGVPHHPPGTHGVEGCRIGDRLDWLFAQLAIAQKERDEARNAAFHMHDGELVHQLRQRITELESALRTARATIRALHGPIAWPHYLHSPEMQQIAAALAATAPDA